MSQSGFYHVMGYILVASRHFFVSQATWWLSLPEIAMCSYISSRRLMQDLFRVSVVTPRAKHSIFFTPVVNFIFWQGSHGVHIET